MTKDQPHFPECAPIDAYGGGGFRFAGVRHEGSLLILPSGMYGWKPQSFDDAVPKIFRQAFDEAAAIDFLLFGTGVDRINPPPALVRAFVRAGIGLEVMNTGAACRTYNALLGEGRALAAALLTVE